MAKASFVTTNKPDVTLSLSFKEAQAVHLVIGKVGGTCGIRPQADAVYRALDSLLKNEDQLPYSAVSGQLTTETL